MRSLAFGSGPGFSGIGRDIAILAAGHFGILATGVDNLTLEDLKIDTNRDGINVDCCRNVRISKCSVSSPWDDGICLKSSFAPGEARATENVTISDCYLTGGFALGAMLDGTFRRKPMQGSLRGRIKCGTELNGGFRNITELPRFRPRNTGRRADRGHYLRACHQARHPQCAVLCKARREVARAGRN